MPKATETESKTRSTMIYSRHHPGWSEVILKYDAGIKIKYWIEY